MVFLPCTARLPQPSVLKSNLHFPSRQLIDLRMAHADLDARIDRSVLEPVPDEFLLRRLKKQRLALRDQIDCLERALQPPEPA